MSFLEKYPGVREGMIARSLDGEKLGKVVSMGDDHFTIEKGIFFPKNFTFRYDDIQEFRDGELILSRSQGDFTEWRDESYPGWSQVDELNTGRLNALPKEEFRDRYSDFGRSSEETRVSVMEEDLEARKTMKQAGEIKIRKIVHTELKHFTIPVMKEEVRVERVPASGARAEAGVGSSLATGEAAFKEKTVTVPIMEEDVTITKTPRVKEEVRVTKERHEEQRDVSGEVRKEEIEIEGEDALRGKKAG